MKTATALNRDKKNALVTVATLLAVVAFIQIVGYGKVTHHPASTRNHHVWHPRSTTQGPEGRACISHICVFFDVTFAEEYAGRIIFLLYDKKVSLPPFPHHVGLVFLQKFQLWIMEGWRLDYKPQVIILGLTEGFRVWGLGCYVPGGYFSLFFAEIFGSEFRQW